MNAIQIKNITKRYKDVTALDDISFSFEFGRIYGQENLPLSILSQTGFLQIRAKS